MQIGRLLAALTLMISLNDSVMAQVAPVIPLRQGLDEHNVDVVNGNFVLSVTDVAIGPSDGRGLSFTRTMPSGFASNNMTFYLVPWSNSSSSGITAYSGFTAKNF